jgi:lantibiotic biosynthesis protein
MSGEEPVTAVGDGAALALTWRTAGLRLAHDLAASAVWRDDMCAFHGARPPVALDAPPLYGSVGGDVYEGSSGIARFLGRAATVAGDRVLADTALGAMRHALRHASGWSLFTGALGAGLTALELAETLETPSLVPAAVQLIEQASEAAAHAAAPYDLLTGTAGVVVGLAAAVRYDLDGGWVQRGIGVGRGLLDAAVPDGPDSDDGPPLSWRLEPGSSDRLCGLAHGASGVALAFEALHRLAPHEGPWRSAARRARAFERAHYSATHGSWADLRAGEHAAVGGPTPYPHMWCHGSIGVTAERLGALDDLLARTDAVGGLAGALAHARRLAAGPAGPGADDSLNGSLCHGLAGLIDLFVDAWQVTGDTSWMAVAGELADLLLNDARRDNGWRSGIRGGWPAPGLMLGHAGMGWALLRVADPHRVSSGWRIGPVVPVTDAS